MAYPVLDRNGVELHPGDRVRFTDAAYYINLTSGTGTVRSLDDFGGIYIDTDEPMRKYGRDGAALEPTRSWYFCCAFDYAKRARVALRSLGDPYEHGQMSVWVEKEDR